ncbi:MAG TPA: hypothetical protein OIM20_01445 [Eggerthellaceae bacterium]|nr:hypothetical protein [Eggerthellaceae bacterium]
MLGETAVAFPKNSVSMSSGGMNKLVELMMQGNLMTSDAVLPLAVTLVWTVVCAILFVALFKRLTRDN